ncbi:MAG: PCRF domain-containing protein [Phycisphaera sp.]|nr:PCRF domain-containing protein [Phycisphaera sp.]
MPSPHDSLFAKLDALASEFDTLEKQLVDPDVVSDHQRVRELSIRRSAMEGLVTRYRACRALERQIADNEAMVNDKNDAELAELAAAELPTLRESYNQLVQSITEDLVTADDRAVGSVILEIRAGTGGAEAALWAGDLLAMYEKLAIRKGFTVGVLETSGGEQGGIRQAVCQVAGPGVWQTLGYEGGVHCVKRVPATETQGRVHTSTATVAVLPEPEKLQIDIPESDVKMDITTAQGPGGQNVNKVATAVKLVHIPTGIEVRMQESKSQQQNRVKAWQLLRARVYDLYQKQKHAERSAKRSAMIGSGERSERVRTYRWKESIVVDHRLEQSFPLNAILNGDMDELTNALIAKDREQRLATL